ncbi:MAG: hypothetical protein ACKOAY_09230 [Haliscomenobacter sp.]
MKKITSIFTRILPALGLASLLACQPLDGDELQLHAPEGVPQMAVSFVADDPNRIVVSDQTTDAFSRLWSAPGAQPDKSTKNTDTLFFPKAGSYTLTLYTSFQGGGVRSSNRQVTITQDAQTGCTDLVKLLVGSCDPAASKCWTMSKVAGAVGVGPIPGSVEWYKSPVNGLQAEQYDDSFCFGMNGGFSYKNNGLTVDPWNGYSPVPYNPPSNQTWTINPTGGLEGVPRLTLTEGAFLGVWDASNVYDIVSITPTQMIVQTPFLKGGGWFQLTLVAK